MYTHLHNNVYGEANTPKFYMFFGVFGLPYTCIHVIHACVVTFTNTNWLKWENIFFFFFYGDAVESPRRQGWAQVAEGRCSQAEEYTWNNPSTVKRRGVLRQSLTAKTPELLFMFGDIKSSSVWLELSCGLTSECSHLLVDWWYYNPGREGEERWEKREREVLYTPDSPAICLMNIKRTEI